jgi:hypothetical protein
MSLIEFFQLRNIRQQQEQTNDLLEQIRRQGLTPAERIAEDLQRKADEKELEKSNKAAF